MALTAAESPANKIFGNAFVGNLEAEMPTLAMVWENLVDGLMVVSQKLRLRNRTSPSSFQINVTGDHNAINVVLPGAGRDSANTSSSGASRAVGRPGLDGPVASSRRLASGGAQSMKR